MDRKPRPGMIACLLDQDESWKQALGLPDLTGIQDFNTRTLTEKTAAALAVFRSDTTAVRTQKRRREINGFRQSDGWFIKGAGLFIENNVKSKDS